MISTRGRYALRVLVDLAEHRNGFYIPMKEVAERQNISLKYIEKITPLLTKEGFIEGAHGKGGGYRLSCDPRDCRVGDILRLTEGDLAPVACLSNGNEPCDRASECRTIDMWKRFYKLTNDFFDGITIADLMKDGSGTDYII
ncbi:MAG: Rrf2 family transcriptional regulator [Firmicutes bacterium]|nr:Rrf2 family transcriptional regulator [Bacillota bacterium]